MTLLVTRTGNHINTRYVENIPTPAGGTVRWQLCEIVVGGKTYLAVATRDAAENELQNFIIEDRLRAEKVAATAIAGMQDLEYDSTGDKIQPHSTGMIIGYCVVPADTDDEYVEFVLGGYNPAQTTA
jgi:hypothetical protein